MAKKKDIKSYDTYALVTGAAGGMGAIYSERLALMGYNLIMVDINEDRLSQAAQNIKDKVVDEKFNVIPMVQDLSVMDAAESIKARADEAGAVVEVLVNNAGLLFATGIAETSPKRLKLMMMVHCMTPLLLCREFVPGMKERHNGYVLNVSSLAAWMEWPAIGMYGNTQRFVKGFSRSLRCECKGTGVSVTNAYFGAVDTPLIPLKPSLKKLARNLTVMISPEKAVDKALKATFRRRKGTLPGLLNKIFKPILVILPDFALAWAYRKFGHYFVNI
ncbi:MAG: SDR family NAD(P)-dependent oxidoreductase [Bacteroidales bacterium]|nr:SDR family NAD(P)-dependent oxidoreductase [Bacteroidales bacterium]